MPLLSLLDALTLFLYFLQSILVDTSSVSKQERQSPEAISRSASAKFPLDNLESEDAWSLVLPKAWRWSGEPLGEWSYFSCEEVVDRKGKGCPTKGVPDRGMSGIEDTSGGEVPEGEVKTLEGSGAGKPQGSGSGSVGHGSDIDGMPSTSWTAVATTQLM